MKATPDRTGPFVPAGASAAPQWATKDMISVLHLSGLVLAEHAALKMMEASLEPALIDFRSAVLVASPAELCRFRTEAGGSAVVALLGTEAQTEVLREAAWRMSQAGFRSAAFQDEAQALEWMALWGIRSMLPAWPSSGAVGIMSRHRRNGSSR